MEQVIVNLQQQPHSNQKRLLAEALAGSHERAIFVDSLSVTRIGFARKALVYSAAQTRYTTSTRKTTPEGAINTRRGLTSHSPKEAANG